jgi:acyl-CoA reductase-like NAD-dependent aldehyde dehydrogenase
VPPSEKRMYFLKAADILEKRSEEYAMTLAEETGAAIAFALFQTHLGPGFLREAASQVHRVSGKTIPADLPGAFNMVLRQPVGVVGAISPWNAPLVLSLRAIVFPLAYGNTVVLKPSAESPVSGGVLILQILEEAGFPKGVINLVTNGPGRSGEVGDEFITDTRVRRITFTGSTEVGRTLAEKAGRHLKKITLELGGNDPLLILKDADIDYAVDAAVFGRFMHQGQVCMNSKRIIVEKSVAESFTKKFVQKVSTLKVGDPRRTDTVIGPLINKSQLNKLVVQVEKAVKQGAKLLCGGNHEGLCYHPSVLSQVTEEMEIFHEETFGPVASVITADNAEEALRMANNSQYGLSSGIITNDFRKGLEIAEKLESGVCHINDSSLHDEAHAPLGGMKDSGWGRNGFEAMDEFTELRWVSFQKTRRQYPI